MYGFQFPMPPVNAVMPTTLEFWLTLIFGGLSLLWVVFALWQAIKTKDLLPLYVVIGGALAIFYEPIGDTLEMAFYPPHGQTTWLDLFGRKIPLFIGVSFFYYFGLVVWGFMTLQAKGWTAKLWWGFFLGLVVSRVMMDEIILSFGSSWIYYGPQPFQFRYFPLWVAFPTAVFQVVAGAGVSAIASKLPTRQHWAVIPAIPLLFLIGHACAVLPAAIALYNTSNTGLLYTGALGSVFMSCFIIWIVGKWFVTPPVKINKSGN